MSTTAYCSNILMSMMVSLIFISCNPGLETSITEPLPGSEMKKLDINQTKLYDNLQYVLARKSKSEQAALLDVTYTDYFNFMLQINENSDIWRKEAHEKWLYDNKNALTAIDNYYQKWVEWERENSLDRKIQFKLHKIKTPEVTYGDLYIDFDLVSHIGKLKKVYIEFGFDTPENYNRSKTNEFSVTVILGDNRHADAPIGDTFSFKDKHVYNCTPEYLTGKSSEEILSKYKLLTKISSATLEDETLIFSSSHIDQIPAPIVDLWKKEKRLSVNYKEIDGFYDNEAVEIASLANVKYEAMTQYMEARIQERINAINRPLAGIYKDLKHKIY